jgi:hypothetical protein
MPIGVGSRKVNLTYAKSTTHSFSSYYYYKFSNRKQLLDVYRVEAFLLFTVYYFISYLYFLASNAIEQTWRQFQEVRRS